MIPVRPNMPLVAAMVAGAVLVPLPLHVAALAVFGLPHVLWELAFLRRRYAAHWPGWWWSMLWLVLLSQAALRGVAWATGLPAELAQAADLLALALGFLVVLLAPRSAGLAVRLAGLTAAACMVGVLAWGDLLVALLLLSVAHNLTPIAMAWDMARVDTGCRRLAWTVSALFALPVVVACLPWSWSPALVLTGIPSGLLDGQLPHGWGGERRGALLAGIVLAQCLHYYCVIRLLPQAEAARGGGAVLAGRLRAVAVAASAALLVAFAANYGDARRLYAIAAGVHAWLEWPVLLMAFLSAYRGTGGAASMSR